MNAEDKPMAETELELLQRLEFEAGVMLGGLQKRNITPGEAMQVLTFAVAYMCERQSLVKPKEARDRFVTLLDELLSQVS